MWKVVGKGTIDDLPASLEPRVQLVREIVSLHLYFFPTSQEEKSVMNKKLKHLIFHCLSSHAIGTCFPETVSLCVENYGIT